MVYLKTLAFGFFFAACAPSDSGAVSPSASQDPKELAHDVPLVRPGVMFTGEIVLALHEDEYLPIVEDERHPRVLVFADGRVLYRRRDGQLWRWYVARIPEPEVKAVQREVAEDLAAVPQYFSCYDRDHLDTTTLLVRVDGAWRIRQVRALWACLQNPERNKRSTQHRREGESVTLPTEFERAYSRLSAFDAPGAAPYFAPELALQLSRARAEEGPADRWPNAIPKPSTPVREGEHVLLGEYDEVVRTLVPYSARWAIGPDTWRVTVSRTMPGDAEFAAAMAQARKTLAHASEAQCRDVMRAVRRCLESHPELDSVADALCHDYTLHAEAAESCLWEELDKDPCAHAYKNGCAR